MVKFTLMSSQREQPEGAARGSSQRLNDKKNLEDIESSKFIDPEAEPVNFSFFNTNRS